MKLTELRELAVLAELRELAGHCTELPDCLGRTGLRGIAVALRRAASDLHGTTGPTSRAAQHAVALSGPAHHVDQKSLHTTQRITPRAERETWRGVARLWRFVPSLCTPRPRHGLPHALGGGRGLAGEDARARRGVPGRPQLPLPFSEYVPTGVDMTRCRATPVDLKSMPPGPFSGQL
ncbi:hypothetical protein GCM10010319_31590 [Streptomyces blastmyceticus]|uniref:Uncharacterized protein n=1 Tax=Streptomyces blastmyceticus TaxID=68180 RepID=A0ABP3GUL5_9ACTN